MALEPAVLAALAKALEEMKGETGAIPAGALDALAPIARPGMRLRIDLAASDVIGAPLVTVTEPARDTQFLAGLTVRQREVAGLLIDGMSNKAIAAELGISIATVKDHVHAILQALQLPSRSAVMAAAHKVRSD
ncbi:LuxR C-terminal-related transcriptional regulator [Yoonia sp. SDW83-1]|uniref:LuxR C-terminal-related transcriptional regulator n=1 Tax=Yoonia sp. SDW83-1 TaxID=3366945 RepID=UPI00398C7948